MKHVKDKFGERLMDDDGEVVAGKYSHETAIAFCDYEGLDRDAARELAAHLLAFAATGSLELQGGEEGKPHKNSTVGEVIKRMKPGESSYVTESLRRAAEAFGGDE